VDHRLILNRFFACRRFHNEGIDTPLLLIMPRPEHTVQLNKPNQYNFRLRNDLYCVEWGVKLYSLTHSLIQLPDTYAAV